MHTPDLNAPAMAIRERCRTLGIPALRCDPAGRLLDTADDSPLSFLLRSRWLQDAIAVSAAQWAAEPAPRISEPADGVYLVPVAEGTARVRNGYTLALTMSPQWLDSPVLASVCEHAEIAPARAAEALGPIAIHTRASAEMLRASLRWMYDDIARTIDQTDALRDLTAQLTDSYETLDALYSIGKSMHGLSDPGAFVLAAVGRLHASLRFETVFVLLSGEATLTTSLRERLFLTGRTPGAMAEMHGDRDSALLAAPAAGKFRIITGDPRLTDDDHPEALVVPLTRGQASIGALVGMHKSGSDTAISSYDIQLMETTAGFISAFLDNVAVYEEQRQLFLGTVHSLTAAIDAKDRYTCGHSERVAHLSARLAHAAGYTPEQVHRVWIAGLVHDVGKIGVPEAVLCKQGKLTDEEFAHIKRHPEIGHHILKDIAPLADVMPGVLHHHEKYDGRGYPARLVGEAIPRLARIIALADTFDAMSSTRAYRPAMPREKVLEEIRRCSGTQFDPVLAELFVALDFGEYDAMVERSRAAEAWSAAA